MIYFAKIFVFLNFFISGICIIKEIVEFTNNNLLGFFIALMWAALCGMFMKHIKILSKVK